MFKFIKQYAETIKGVDIYPLVSMFIFVLFFILLLVYVKKMDKKKISELSNIPLDGTEAQSLTN
jgi:hypothetical protein